MTYIQYFTSPQVCRSNLQNPGQSQAGPVAISASRPCQTRLVVVFSAGLVLALGRLGELDPTTDLVVLPVVGQSTIEIEQTHCHRGGTFHEEIANR